MARLDQHDVARPQFLLQQLIGSVDVLDPGRPLAIRSLALGPAVDRLRPLADGNHSRYVQAHRESTEGLMFGGGSGPQLTHLAQHCPRPPTLAHDRKGRRTWAVLGEMRELGPGSTAEHEALGRLAVRLN